jgi:hypothetical protein
MKIRDVRDRDGDRDRDRDRYADTDRVIEIDRDGERERERERERVDENAEFDRWVVKRSNGGWGGGERSRVAITSPRTVNFLGGIIFI